MLPRWWRSLLASLRSAGVVPGGFGQDVGDGAGRAGLAARHDAARASAPETISLISWVMSAWRAWFASRV
ncbi:Uncharacterised protein [Mycobacteroides abscessus]|nr:Uncharacterised protein [Mycobacteroides abscessus]